MYQLTQHARVAHRIQKIKEQCMVRYVANADDSKQKIALHTKFKIIR